MLSIGHEICDGIDNTGDVPSTKLAAAGTPMLMLTDMALTL